MRITRVEATYLRQVPIEPPPFRPEPSRRDVVVLEVETDAGIVGHAPVADTKASPATCRAINTVVADLVTGQDPRLVEQVWLKMTGALAGRGLERAMSAVDTALWDIRGKDLGLPVWRLLGGARPSIPVYITFGATGPNTGHSDAPAYSRDELVEEAVFHARTGQRALKMGVARAERLDTDVDAGRVAAVREAVGPDVQIMVDGRCRLPLDDAIRLCRMLEPMDIAFFEDPVLRNDAAALAQLRASTSIPLAANAEGGDREAYLRLLIAESIEVVQMNAAKIGFTESIAIAGMAQAFGRRVSNGNGNGPHNAHFQAGIRNGSIVEYHLNIWMLYRALFEQIPEPVNGIIDLAESPGFGMDLRTDVIQAHRSSPA